MSARPGPGGGYRATGIPTAISLTGSLRLTSVFQPTVHRRNFQVVRPYVIG